MGVKHMKIKPTGFYVLVEVDPIEEKTKGGIVIAESLAKKEHAATEEGHIRAFGPCAYVGWKGCENPDIPAYEQWGVNIGDRVEFQRYEGKKCVVKGYENFRYIPDTHIIGVISDE
jgi:co-chaperonin GroES (HSP10)